MNYHKITRFDTANGLGIGVVLWVSGCNHGCRNCHNPQTWSLFSGKPFDMQQDLKKLINYTAPDYVERLTLSGGDPLHPSNQADVCKILFAVRDALPNKKIWVYTGYTVDQVAEMTPGNFVLKYKLCDYLVDGEFIEAQKNLNLAYRGSENQRIIDIQNTTNWNHPMTLEKL